MPSSLLCSNTWNIYMKYSCRLLINCLFVFLLYSVISLRLPLSFVHCSISPPGIAMTNGLYCCCFYFPSYFRHLIAEVTERMSTKLRHTFTYDCYLKIWSELPRALTPTGWGQKRYFGTDFVFWPKISLQRNRISTIRKKLVSLLGLPHMPPNLVNFGPETAENGWIVLPSP